MSCKITGMDQGISCVPSDGGIYESYGTELANILTVTYSATGELTAMTQTAAWEYFVFDDDDSAFYNQEGERTNNKVTVNQSAFIKFSGVNSTKIQNAQNIMECCATVWIHRLNSGANILQGLDHTEDDPVGELKASKQKAKVTPNVMSDTGDNEDRLEYNINSVGRSIAPHVADAVIATLLVTTP